MDHAKVAGEVVDAVGGASNISAAAHCATRLRLVIADESTINQQALDDNEDLKGTFAAGGMFQIIVGPGDVDQVYAHMVSDHGVIHCRPHSFLMIPRATSSSRSALGCV